MSGRGPKARSHPIKNATEDQLIPYGSGAILNEVDGNFTLWKNEAEQLPRTGRAKSAAPNSTRRNSDSKSPAALTFSTSRSSQVLLPTLRPSTAQAAEERRQSDAEDRPGAAQGDGRRTERHARSMGDRDRPGKEQRGIPASTNSEKLRSWSTSCWASGPSPRKGRKGLDLRVIKNDE